MDTGCMERRDTFGGETGGRSGLVLWKNPSVIVVLVVVAAAVVAVVLEGIGIVYRCGVVAVF
jgi:hypothetical protein